MCVCLPADVKLQLMGAHQLDNAATAVATAAVLRAAGFDSISPQSIAGGLLECSLPGRFQVCRLADKDADALAAARPSSSMDPSEGGGGSGPAAEARIRPLVVLDGAHTPESAAALAATLRQVFPTAPVALVLAMAGDKAHREVCMALRAVQPHVVVFTSVAIAGGRLRAASPGALAAAWQGAGGAPVGVLHRGIKCMHCLRESPSACRQRGGCMCE
jgi:folylpolyglutamate synthase/dihydropteroate synthase